MCGVAVSKDAAQTAAMRAILRHRGPDASAQVEVAGVHVGFNRLRIVDSGELTARQPLRVAGRNTVTVFNGEIYNQASLHHAMRTDGQRVQPIGPSEVAVIEALVTRAPRHVHRFLDGYYGIVHVDGQRGQVWAYRDFPGVIPLYYQHRPWFGIASERKALIDPRPVPPGGILRFDAETGRLTGRWQFDPVSMHGLGVDDRTVRRLLFRAVERRVEHAEGPVTLALSGGVDSCLLLLCCAALGVAVRPVTVTTNPDGWEARVAVAVSKVAGMETRLVVVDPVREWARTRHGIMRALEVSVGARPNPIKLAASLRHWLVAEAAPGRVILCGEGADEVFGGYPPHRQSSGLWHAWTRYRTVRSMPAINLDRVNKIGMALSKEYRVPFLDRALLLAVLGAAEGKGGKGVLFRLARRLGFPAWAADKPKYSEDEVRLWAAVTAPDAHTGGQS